MRNLLLRTTLATTALATLLFGALLLPRNAAGQHANQGTHSPAQQPPSTTPSSTDSSTTSQGDQTDLSVTVYNSDLALVRDVRDLHRHRLFRDPREEQRRDQGGCHQPG